MGNDGEVTTTQVHILRLDRAGRHPDIEQLEKYNVHLLGGTLE